MMHSSNACLKEAMRLHPVIDFVARALQKDLTIAGWDIPKGATVAPSIGLPHSSNHNFADAHLYCPRRLLDDHIAPNTWIPFDGDVRRCIGAGISLMEGTTILREVLQHYRLAAAEPSRTRLRNITNAPCDKAPLVLFARASAD